MSGSKIATSTTIDGSMKRTGNDARIIEQNRVLFLAKHHTSPDKSVLVQLDYDSDDFCRYEVVDENAAGEGMTRSGRVADGLATQAKNLGLFLPLADCNGVVLHDPVHQAIMLTHLGRHNLEQYGGVKSVEFMIKQFGSNPAKLHVHFSPCAGKKQYPLHSFGDSGIAEISKQQLCSVGVLSANIIDPDIDTTIDANYFSHSEFLRGNRSNDGRFAVLAMLTD